MLFKPVRLSTLYEANYKSVDSLINSQKEAIKESVLAASDGIRPPEIRLIEIDGSGKALLYFTNEMNFPDNFADIINARKDAYYEALSKPDQDPEETYRKL